MQPVLEEHAADILDLPYYKEVQQDIWLYERKKTMIGIFIISGIILLTDVISFDNAGLLTTSVFLYLLIVPLIFAAIALLALKEPLVAILIVAFIFTGIIGLAAYRFGAETILSGWIAKLVIFFFILRGFFSARQAEAARKNLKGL